METRLFLESNEDKKETVTPVVTETFDFCTKQIVLLIVFFSSPLSIEDEEEWTVCPKLPGEAEDVDGDSFEQHDPILTI